MCFLSQFWMWLHNSMLVKYFTGLQVFITQKMFDGFPGFSSWNDAWPREIPRLCSANTRCHGSCPWSRLWFTAENVEGQRLGRIVQKINNDQGTASYQQWRVLDLRGFGIINHTSFNWYNLYRSIQNIVL